MKRPRGFEGRALRRLEGRELRWVSLSLAAATLASGPALADQPSDARITTKAKMRLMATTGIPAMSVNVDTVDGVVTLFGIVPTTLEKQRAEAAIRELEGVARVDNELQVVPNVAAGKVSRSDDEVTQAVRERIDDRVALSDADLEIETANGVVRLTGHVDEAGDRLTALTVARNTPGVRSVVDDIAPGPAR